MAEIPKKMPVAVCTDCISYSFSESDIDTGCGRHRGEHRCKGVYVDARDPINWKECTACSGTGIAFDGLPCRACQESGWILTRRRN